MIKRRATTREDHNRAIIPGIPLARNWGDAVPPYAKDWFETPREELHARYAGIVNCEHNYLAISGGGANGAFGAGLLKGWTTTGSRPEFTIVTGISTGALSAPFAFLGSDWDDRLEEVYTRYSTRDLIRKTPFAALTSSAIYSTTRLHAMIEKYIDAKMFAAIGREFSEKGRSLLIGTTDLDALRPVIWNLGRIAASGMPGSRALAHKIILASASIPIAFPPVPIEVEIDGKRCDELHVDGGAAAQVFLYPTGIDWRRVLERLEVQGMPNVYMIRNSRILPLWEEAKPMLLPIALRTTTSLIRTQGIGDMFRVYLAALRDGIKFNLAHIPDDFESLPAERFDPAHMRELFDLGYDLAKTGYPWKETPPGF